MLNHNVKKYAEERLEAAERVCQEWSERVTQNAARLFDLRNITALRVIRVCEKYINTLANSPKEFDKSVAEFKFEYQQFNELSHQIKAEAEEKARIRHSQVGAGVAAGVAAGVGVAAFAPSMAMAIATTFGTASTGTAVAGLSGAAATNAALAWLGGGALVAGGGGMAGGQALLAMAGPVGWAIGGTAMAFGAFLSSRQNEEFARKATQAAIEIEEGVAELKAADTEVTQLDQLTREHAVGVCSQLEELNSTAPNDYLQFGQEQKQMLAALINNVRALSQFLTTKIS